MMQNRSLRKILLTPFSWLYGIGVWIHTYLYSKNILRSTKFDFPIIAVGNISAGGTGKTPHIIYLAKYLREYIPVAILSRGYGRKTRGYLYVQASMPAKAVGDEPLLFKTLMPEVHVAVCEQRIYGVPELLTDAPDTKVILLDDAFQHRAIVPGYNIILTEFTKPYTQDQLLPAGHLREPKNAVKRSDIVIVTKCPDNLSVDDAQKLATQLDLMPHQNLYFSKMKYGAIYPLLQDMPNIENWDQYTVLVYCGIATPHYMIDYVKKNVKEVFSLIENDHHHFEKEDILKLYNHVSKINNPKKIILTTEKDAVRLHPLKEHILKNELQIYVLPIEIEILFDKKEAFEIDIRNFLLNFEI